MGVLKIALCETHLGLMNKGSLDKTIYKTMASLIGSCWFYLINSLFFVARVITLHIFRIRMDDNSRKDDRVVSATKGSKGLEPLLEVSEMEEGDDSSSSEVETSSFCFKFEYQFSDDPMKASAAPANPETNGNIPSQTTEIRKYCFSPDKDFSGFIEQPGAMTFCVQESYSDHIANYVSGKEKLDSESSTGFLPAQSFQQFDGIGDSNELKESEDDVILKHKLLEEEKPIGSETNSSGEKDSGAFVDELNSVAFRVYSYAELRKKAMNVEEKLDTTFTKGSSPEKEVQQSNNFRNLNGLVKSIDATESEKKLRGEDLPMHSENNILDEKDSDSLMEEPEAIMFYARGRDSDCSNDDINDEEDIDTQLTTGFLLTSDFQQSTTFKRFTKKEKLKDNFLDEEVYASSGTSSLDKNEVLHGGKFLSESFSDFESDTESVSASYSVKELEYPDSDDFLSERDYDEHGNEINTTEISVDSDGYKAEPAEDIKESGRDHQQLLYNSDTKRDDSRGGFVYTENQHNYEDTTKGFLPMRESYGSKNKPEEKLQTLKEIQLPCSNALLIESTVSGDDQHPSFRTHNNRLSSLDEVFWEKDLTCPESKLQDLGGEDAGSVSGIHYFEPDHLHNLHHSDTVLDGSISMISAPTNDSEQVDSELVQRDSDVMREPEDLRSKKVAPEADLQKSKETHEDNSDTEDLDELESLWEHQFLIEQLKMELRKVRSIGLPTILEESESPKTSEDIKPWKIDEKFQHEDPMDEMHKFYKSYRERMRKLDILNYQKMYAIGFLQLKDPLKSIGSHKPTIPTILSYLSQSFWPFCRQKSSGDPSEKFLKDLQSDLETVYVGQTCLSWEFLRWQYEKARELSESDLYRSHQYNEVAGEFQQFQVIIQRFIENESFQGPRLPNYVKNRCVLRNLLQVPVIKEDCLRDKMEEQKMGTDAVTSEMLEDIMEETIRIFWEFVKADKNGTPTILKGLTGAHVELQDPSDFEFMMDVHAILQKKEKKLKDILRTGNCLVKKFKKPQEGRLTRDLFFSQVDLKLVSMVLKMSRIATEQLVWCHKKLNKITFTNRKVRRKPSFLLFPC